MNEKLARKLGELLAFSEVGHNLFEKNRQSLIMVWDTDEVSLMTEERLGFAEQIKIFADKEKVTDSTLAKAAKTKEKLEKMQDLYLAGDTDPIEIMEWLSFFEGAAAAHANLVLGLAQNNAEVASLAKEMSSFHRKVSEKVSTTLFETGKKA